jgi:uncharacterized protein YbjT (DUF2867 family)
VAGAVVLVAGASGYVGGRLVPRLLEEGRQVRCLARDPGRLRGQPWLDRVEVVRGDVLDRATLPAALAGVDVAYYLVHSLAGAGDFALRDVGAGGAFGEAARASGVRRIVYLGGLGESSAALSPHLRSRQRTGEALRAAGVPVVELRAAIIVGAGSASFEIVRLLTERLPVMICPRWVYSRVQPIAIADALAYLVAAADAPIEGSGVVEIGGADVLSYGDMMREYARLRGRRRLLIPVPVLTPRLSSYWVHWITPMPAAMARPLIEGLRNEVVVRDPSARRLFPKIHPVGYIHAVSEALDELRAAGGEPARPHALRERGLRFPWPPRRARLPRA